jgi:hypothetical protein
MTPCRSSKDFISYSKCGRKSARALIREVACPDFFFFCDTGIVTGI